MMDYENIVHMENRIVFSYKKDTKNAKFSEKWIDLDAYYLSKLNQIYKGK